MEKVLIIRSEQDIRLAISAVRQIAQSVSFSEVDLQKVMVATSELTQNILDHTEGVGVFKCDDINGRGIRIAVQDNGKGIKELKRIFGGDTGFNKKGLGLGLAGAKRLLDEFQIDTSERGTKIIGIKWKK